LQQLMPDSANIKQRRLRGRIDQHVQVAIVPVGLIKNGTKDPGVQPMMARSNPADEFAVLFNTIDGFTK
jgi:hypothetical protein